MQFCKTQTYLNLAKSFAGESQAGMRYQLAAQKAMEEGYKCLSDVIRSIAKNETLHAKIFFEHLVSNGGNAENILIEAGYPFRDGSLEECLCFAKEDEKNEEERIYPEYAEIARKEGYEDIAYSFEAIAKIEGAHKIIFNYLYGGVKNKTLYKTEDLSLWICSECGHMHSAKEAFKICPVCKAEQGYVELHLPYDYIGKNVF